MTTRQIVLASTSKYRKRLLERLGLAFECANPEIDESRYRDLGAEVMVRTLSREKAFAVATRFPNAIVIGSDQCAELDGEILGKPGTEELAAHQLERLSGRTHRLLTGVAILDVRVGVLREHLDVQELRMRTLRPDQLVRYVLNDQPMDCAGAYKLESKGIALFESVRGQDPSAIEGLPLMSVSRILFDLGVDVF